MFVGGCRPQPLALVGLSPGRAILAGHSPVLWALDSELRLPASCPLLLQSSSWGIGCGKIKMHLARLLHRITALEIRLDAVSRLSASLLVPPPEHADIPYHNRWLWPFLPHLTSFHKTRLPCSCRPTLPNSFGVGNPIRHCVRTETAPTASPSELASVASALGGLSLTGLCRPDSR